MRSRKNAKSTKCIAQHIPTQLRSFSTKIFLVNSRTEHAFAFCLRFARVSSLSVVSVSKRWRRRRSVVIKMRYLRLRLKNYGDEFGKRKRLFKSSEFVFIVINFVINLRQNQLNAAIKLLCLPMRISLHVVLRIYSTMFFRIHATVNTILTYGNLLPEVSYIRREWMTFARDAHICVKIARRDRYERMYRIYQKSYFLSAADFHEVSFHKILLS